MKNGDVWFKRRQNEKKCRFFAVKKGNNSGFHAITMTRQSLCENTFLSNESLEGFERRNTLLTENEIAKYILLGDLNPVIL